MTTGVAASVEPGARSQGDAEQRHADVCVVFGITGDLARVMTFRSLWRSRFETREERWMR